MKRPGLIGFVTALTACLSLTLFAAERKAWITMGDVAFHQVRQFVPDIVSIESRQLAGGGETIHAVRVAESRQALHALKFARLAAAFALELGSD